MNDKLLTAEQVDALVDAAHDRKRKQGQRAVLVNPGMLARGVGCHPGTTTCTTPGGASYTVEKGGLRRLDKVRGLSKKERRAARRANKG